MNVFNIDAEWFSNSIAAVLGCEPSTDYKTGERRLSPDGVPQWTLSVALQPDNARASIAEISIASNTEPDVHQGGRPVFEGLQARHWTSNKGGRSSSGVMLTAESVSTPVAA